MPLDPAACPLPPVPQARNQTLVFPRRAGGGCTYFCNGQVAILKDALEQGMRSGRLRLPEGLPLLLNVHDHPALWTTVRAL